jgi:hypothetical protein
LANSGCCEAFEGASPGGHDIKIEVAINTPNRAMLLIVASIFNGFLSGSNLRRSGVAVSSGKQVPGLGWG